MTEEERAAAYRAQAITRRRAEVARLRALAGDPAARLALTAAWQPLLTTATGRQGARPSVIRRPQGARR